MKLSEAVPVNSHGIKLHALLKRKDGTWYNREIQWGNVNPHLFAVLDPTLEELADHGAIAIYTYGIRNNRLIRGSSTTTSTHSNGLASNGYKHWRDGSVGALGFDLRKIIFRNLPFAYVIGDIPDGDWMETSLVVTEPSDLKAMIQWLEARDWKLYHKKLNCVNPYHLHLQPANLKGVL